MSIDACARVKKAKKLGVPPEPSDVKACEDWKKRKKALFELLKSAYLVKYLTPISPPDLDTLPPIPAPSPPSPPPYLFPADHLLFAEMFLDILRNDLTPTSTIFSEIRESGVQLEVVKGLLHQFNEATKALKSDLHDLEKGCKRS